MVSLTLKVILHVTENDSKYRDVAPFKVTCYMYLINVLYYSCSTVWSYLACPDVDECKLGLAKCHPNASCVNLPGSFNCICNRGFTGDGVAACNKT